MNIIRLIGIQNGKKIGIVAGSYDYLSTYLSKSIEITSLRFVSSFIGQELDKFRTINICKEKRVNVIDMQTATDNALKALFAGRSVFDA